jgi:hypothetical protein
MPSARPVAVSPPPSDRRYPLTCASPASALRRRASSAIALRFIKASSTRRVYRLPPVASRPSPCILSPRRHALRSLCVPPPTFRHRVAFPLTCALLLAVTPSALSSSLSAPCSRLCSSLSSALSSYPCGKNGHWAGRTHIRTGARLIASFSLSSSPAEIASFSARERECVLPSLFPSVQ